MRCCSRPYCCAGGNNTPPNVKSHLQQKPRGLGDTFNLAAKREIQMHLYVVCGRIQNQTSRPKTSRGSGETSGPYDVIGCPIFFPDHPRKPTPFEQPAVDFTQGSSPPSSVVIIRWKDAADGNVGRAMRFGDRTAVRRGQVRTVLTYVLLFVDGL